MGQITILGAGIAGLATALALARQGRDIRILEQAPALTEVGAGLQMSPNGMAVLGALGLGDQAAALGMAAEAVELVNGEGGGRVARIDLGRLAPPGGFRLFHRADLIGLLAGAARDAGVAIELGHRVQTVRLTDHGAVAEGAGDPVQPPLLIGADGLQSRVRAALEPASAPFFTGQVAWRAVIPAGQGERIPPVARVYMGKGRHLVTYPLRGGALRNIVAVEERPGWVAEGWSQPDDPQALSAAFAGFVPEVRGWLDRVEAPNLWGLFRHPVAARWQAPGVALVGDAAHPTLPFLAQGANMALEDAWMLARALVDLPLAQALPAYQAARRDRAVRLVAAAGANARAYHLSGTRRLVGHAGLSLLSRLAPGLIAGQFRWVYDHDVTSMPTPWRPGPP